MKKVDELNTNLGLTPEQSQRLNEEFAEWDKQLNGIREIRVIEVIRNIGREEARALVRKGRLPCSWAFENEVV